MKNDKGVSLIMLAVTIVVMMILIGVVGVNSFDTINKGHSAAAEREFTSVREYVVKQQIRVETGEFSIDKIKYPDVILTPDLANLLLGGFLTETEINSISDVNDEANHVDDEYLYYYLQADNKYFEDRQFMKGSTTIQDVKNDYIVNFGIGTVICVTEGDQKVEGLVKNLEEIIDLMD